MIVCRFIVSLKSNCALYWTNNIAACSYGPTKGSLKCLIIIILLPNTKTSQSFFYFASSVSIKLLFIVAGTSTNTRQVICDRVGTYKILCPLVVVGSY